VADCEWHAAATGLAARPKIGGDQIVVGGHRYQKLYLHILQELLARRRRRARGFARQFSWQSGVLQRRYTRAFEPQKSSMNSTQMF